MNLSSAIKKYHLTQREHWTDKYIFQGDFLVQTGEGLCDGVINLDDITANDWIECDCNILSEGINDISCINNNVDMSILDDFHGKRIVIYDTINLGNIKPICSKHDTETILIIKNIDLTGFTQYNLMKNLPFKSLVYLGNDLNSLDSLLSYLGLNNIESLDIRNKNVKNIPSFAFKDLNISQLKLPEGLESVDNTIFSNCVNLKEVHLPKSVSHILNNSTFLHKAPSFIANKDSPYFRMIFGGMGIVEKSTEKLVYVCSDINTPSSGQLIVDESIKSLALGVFENCYKLKTIDLSLTKITEIPTKCFLNLDNLHTVILPNTVECISNYAFSGCTSLVEFNVPPNIEYIGTDVLGECKSLSYLIFHNPKDQEYIDWTREQLLNGLDDNYNIMSEIYND